MATDLLAIRTLYAELLDYVESSVFTALPATVSFLFKTVKGTRYAYAQYTDNTGKRRQQYLGPESAVGDRIAHYQSLLEAEAEDLRQRERLVSALRAAGASHPDGLTGRALERLVNSGVFRAGCQLIGTHAYQAYQNVLGTALELAITEDIDVASHLSIAAPSAADASVGDALAELDSRFFPVPPLSHRQPSTAWKIRGRPFKVELLTDTTHLGGTSQPVEIAGLGYAQPLPYLDYITEAPISAVILHGAGVLVSVPRPERFALHKLVVAELRDRSRIAKRAKDLSQAEQLLAWLCENERGAVREAWDALASREDPMRQLALEGLSKLPAETASAAHALRS